MAFTGNENHDISLETASEWTATYRASIPSGAVIAHHLGKNDLITLLNQPECVGMRVYYAIDDNGDKQLIFVGIDENENDLYEGKLLDRSYCCPPSCAASNPLNS